MNRLVKNPRFRQWVRKAFGQDCSVRAILYTYAVVVYEFITVEERETFSRCLPYVAQVKLEYFGQFFKYAERYGHVDDHPEFNELMILNLQKVFGDDRLQLDDRVQVVYATGNLLYLIHLLEQMVDVVEL